MPLTRLAFARHPLPAGGEREECGLRRSPATPFCEWLGESYLNRTVAGPCPSSMAAKPLVARPRVLQSLWS